MSSTRIKQLALRVRQHPDDSFSKFALALELKKTGDVRRALALFESIRTEDPDYTGVYYHLGKTCELMQDPERALEAYRQGLVRTPDSEMRTRSELQEALDQLNEEL
ncbi:MAG: tetratricopeptide repeat protein [Bacteroidota bacterium]